MKILGIKIPDNIMEVYTLWLEYMELKECEKTLIMFLQDVQISNKWQYKKCLIFETRIPRFRYKSILCFTAGYDEIGQDLEQMDLNNIKQQLKEYESSRTDL